MTRMFIEHMYAHLHFLWTHKKMTINIHRNARLNERKNIESAMSPVRISTYTPLHYQKESQSVNYKFPVNCVVIMFKYCAQL